VLSATEEDSLAVITYGMGVYWSKTAAKNFPGKIEIIDLRTINPLDEKAIIDAVKKCNRCLIVTEEVPENSFARAIAGMVAEKCFEYLDAPVVTIGSVNVPAVPLNSTLEAAMLPNAEKVARKMQELLDY
jgi:2-oxoisovalerate dehydrogenase E1 component